MASVVEAQRLVVAWLTGEEPYQFDKFDAMYGNEIAVRRELIDEIEIPQKWHNNVLFRGRGAFDQANQQVLKVLAASRAVLIYDSCLGGNARDAASRLSFRLLEDHLAQKDTYIAPVEALERPYEIAFPETTAMPRFLRAAELAVRAAQLSEELHGEMRLPRPGRPSGPPVGYLSLDSIDRSQD
jgi:hypothetical protein